MDKYIFDLTVKYRELNSDVCHTAFRRCLKQEELLDAINNYLNAAILFPDIKIEEIIID